jgi:hypothetical protein
LAIPGGLVSPWLFLVPILVLIVLQSIGDPVRSSIGLLVVALGVPVSLWVLEHRRHSGEPPSASLAPDEGSPVSAIHTNP